jgi:hypothetical protein
LLMQQVPKAFQVDHLFKSFPACMKLIEESF